MDVEEVLDELIALARRRDRAGLVAACRAHRDLIEAHFADWKTVPAPRRISKDSVEQYVAALVDIAQVFAEELGDATLLATLTGRTELGGQRAEDPQQRWHAELQAAQNEMESGRFTEAAERLEAIIAETEHVRDVAPAPPTDEGLSLVDRYLPVTLGLLGSAYFNEGDIDRAEHTMERALAVSREVGDADGVEAYNTNLMELHRYRGNGAEAARFARALAETVDSKAPRRAARLRTRAAMMEAGEPKLRVVLRLGEDDDDAEYELDELDALVARADRTEQIRFMFERDRVGLAASARITEEADALIEDGRDASAVALLQRAMAIDPHDPGPHHLLARIEMQRQRWDAAIEALRGVEMRVPGWPMVREDLALCEALRDGTYSPALLATLQTLEDGGRPARANLETASGALETLGDHPRLWLARGQAQAELGLLEDARESLAEAIECADEPAVKTRALVALAELGTPSAVRELLQEAIELDGDPVSAAAARLRLALLTARQD